MSSSYYTGDLTDTIKLIVNTGMRLGLIKNKLRKAFQNSVSFNVTSFIQTNYLRGEKIQTRTGGLTRSIKEKVILNGDKLIAEIQAGTEYARILEEGGTIKGESKLLTIPATWIPKVKSKLYTPTGRKKAVWSKGAKSIKNTFVQKSKKGNLFIFQLQKKRGKVDKPLPLFLLKKKVKIPAKKYIEDAIIAKGELVLKDVSIEAENILEQALRGK